MSEQKCHKGLYFLLAVFAILSGCYEEKDIYLIDPDNLLAFDHVIPGIDLQRGMFLLPVSKEMMDNYQPIVFTNCRELIIEGKNYTSGQRIDFSGKQISDSLYVSYIKQNGDIADGYIYFTTLPVMQIFTYEDIPDEPKIDCEIIISSDRFGEGENLSLFAGIETRGRSASFRPKPSFGLEIRQDSTGLSKDISLLGMRSDDDWILDALYIDKARMRNKVSMDLWRDICNVSNNEKVHGNPYTASEYTEVFVNGTYAGIYTLGERMDTKQLDITPTDDITEALLYKTENWSGTTWFRVMADTTSSSQWDGWVQLVPDPDVFIFWQPVYNFTDFVMHSSDSEFENQIENYLDLENLIDYYIFINTCRAFDNMGTNMFYARQSSDNPFIICPWDMDASWGRNFDSTYLSFAGIQDNKYYDRLIELDVNNFNGRMLAKWNDLRSELITHDKLYARFRKNSDVLIESDAIRREALRWPEMHLNLENELNYLNPWIAERIKILDEHFQSLP